MTQPHIVIRRPSMSFEELCSLTIARLEAARAAPAAQLRAVKMPGGGYEMIEQPLNSPLLPVSRRAQR